MNIIILLVLIIINVFAIFLPIFLTYLPIFNTLLLLTVVFRLKRVIPNLKKREVLDYIPPVEVDKIRDEVSVNSNIDEVLNSHNEHLKRLSYKFYYLQRSIPLLEELSLSTQNLESETLKKVFNQFEEIFNESEILIEKSKSSMMSIFDSNGTSNLGYILNSSKDINRDFKGFLPVLESMNNLAENFVNISMDSFNSIRKTTKDIEDLAEQVKVISINVRIEAARIKDSGGFQVLGSDITKFADKTAIFAQDTDEKIKNTVLTIDELKSELTTKLKNVSEMANTMYTKINPFESILDQSASSLKEVIDSLSSVTKELNSNLKTSLGNLQYQDVTSQESNHIIDFLKHLADLLTESEKIDELLESRDKDEIKKSILLFMDKISTTGNEASKLEEFGRKWAVEYKEENKETFDSIDDGTFLF